MGDMYKASSHTGGNENNKKNIYISDKNKKKFFKILI